MSVPMSLLALLDEGPNFGLRLKQEFEWRTGGIWPLNVGQVYTSLDRLEREGLVRPADSGEERQRVYEITPAGQERLAAWFERPVDRSPGRDQLVLKLVMAVRHPGLDPSGVIQAERRGAVEVLQEYTRLKRDPLEDDLGWAFLVDSLIFQAEARVRWLDACEARLVKARGGRTGGPRAGGEPTSGDRGAEADDAREEAVR